PYLRARLRPAPRVDPDRLARLVRDLNSRRFTERERAAEELRQMGASAAPGLRRALEGRPPLEVRLRLGRLLGDLEAPVPRAPVLQTLRAVEALEYAGTDEARRLLRDLAGGAPEAWLTQEAKAALQHLAQRPTP